jgi:Cupin superfamily protein
MGRTQRDQRKRTTANGLVRLDGTGFGDSFAKREPVQFNHTLQDHPLLTLEGIAQLADDLPRDSVIHDTANQSLLVPQGGPPRGKLQRPGDVIRHLDENQSWLTLLNIEQVPAYEQLMNDCLDEVEPHIRDRRMLRRVGFVFVSSPNSTTPAHFDIEHSLIMQMHGQKRLTFGRFERPEDRQHEVVRYWDGSHGRIESLPPEMASYLLTPGFGVYIPPVAPHWVKNGDAISISVTLTFFTPDTDRETLIEAFNARLRRMQLSPRQPGTSSLVDGAKVAAMRAYGLRRHLRHGRKEASSSHY